MGIILEEDKAAAMFDMVKENNRMLKAMRRSAMVGGVIKFVWWIVVIFVIPYLIYVWYLQPYLNEVLATYQEIEGQTQEAKDALVRLQEINNSSGFNKLLEQFGFGSGE